MMQNKPQLFCFTYAGGTASFFDTIEAELDCAELVKFEYAGHGTRHKEPLYSDFNELADDLFNRFKLSYKGADYSLFGYSMGTISLVEVLKRIISSGINLPKYIFLAAHEPHTKTELLGYSSEELDEWVIDRTIRFGAIPERLINNKAFWRMYLPIYRSDYSIIGKYDFENLNLKTVVPVTVFYSETDTPKREISLWKYFFIGECEFHEFSGNHFFYFEHHVEMAALMKTKLLGESNDI